MNQKASNVPMIGGIVAAIGAGVCCIGPLILLLIGVSGSWIGNLTAFEPYRSAFIFFVILSFGYAGWNIYQPVKKCESGTACAVPATQKRRKIIFWLAASASIVLITSNYWILLFF